MVFVEEILYASAGFGDEQGGIEDLVVFRRIFRDLEVDAPDEERDAVAAQQGADAVAVLPRELRAAAVGVRDRGFRPDDQIEFPVRRIADGDQIAQFFITVKQPFREIRADVERLFRRRMVRIPPL